MTSTDLPAVSPDNSAVPSAASDAPAASSPPVAPGAGALSRLARLIGRPVMGLGFDPRKLRDLRQVPRYLAERRAYRHRGGHIDESYPVFSDYEAQAGSTVDHYFHQDLLVAGYVREAAPKRHIDVGSRIDGFVAHVATFREIEVLDVRPLTDIGHPNIRFLQADLMSQAHAPAEITESVSCLHALEHFGLGRYGDPIDPEGHLKGFHNLCRMLEPGGTAYVSFPVGARTQVCFNAHRIFHPLDVLGWCGSQMALVRFDFIDDAGRLHRDWPLLRDPPRAEFGCGIYTLRKASA